MRAGSFWLPAYTLPLLVFAICALNLFAHSLSYSMKEMRPLGNSARHSCAGGTGSSPGSNRNVAGGPRPAGGAVQDSGAVGQAAGRLLQTRGEGRAGPHSTVKPGPAYVPPPHRQRLAGPIVHVAPQACARAQVSGPGH